MNPDIFKVRDIRGHVSSELNYDVCERLGKALADWFPADGPVAVAYDTNPYSEELVQGLMEGLRLQGREVWVEDRIGKETDHESVVSIGIAGGVVVTHQEKEIVLEVYNDKGDRVDVDSGLTDVRDRALADNFVPAAKLGAIVRKD